VTALWTREPGRLSYFQAVRMLLRSRPHDPSQPADEVELDPATAALRVLPSLAFPAAEVQQCKSTPPEVVVSFLGLIGALGVLPAHYTSLIVRRVRERDYALRDFLDVFHHRMLTLYYRAWAKHRLAIQIEQAAHGRHGADTVTGPLWCLLGLGSEQVRGRLALDARLLLFHGGHFARLPRPAAALEQILQDCLAVPIAVEEFQPSWLELAAEDLSRLPAPGEPGRHCQLGVDLVLGERSWDCQGSFRLRVGALRWDQFRSFLPGERRREKLLALTRQFVGPALRFDLQLLLFGDQVPPCRPGHDPLPPLLGWCAWLGGRDPARVAEDAILPADMDVAPATIP
jgi:type VI secretion system protein ImpH